MVAVFYVECSVAFPVLLSCAGVCDGVVWCVVVLYGLTGVLWCVPWVLW